MIRLRYYITLLLLVVIAPGASAQEDKKNSKVKNDTLNIEMTITDTLTNEYLDKFEVKKNNKINDYSLIGIQYGVGLSQMMWNPKQSQQMLVIPKNFGITYTKYGKMFGYMPYFGFQVGVFYAQEGYKFKENKDNGYTYTIQGADKAIFDVIEVPVLTHIHFDFWKMKVIANIGFYGGYRLKVERFPLNGEYTSETYESNRNKFLETDRRFDYGIKGGLGFGFIFDPIEIHITAMYKHSLSSIYEPDHYSKYYYRYAYPINIVISAGVHFQLTKRVGKTKREIRNEAKRLVYGNN